MSFTLLMLFDFVARSCATKNNNVSMLTVFSLRQQLEDELLLPHQTKTCCLEK